MVKNRLPTVNFNMNFELNLIY